MAAGEEFRERRELHLEARRARYLARLVGKAADLIIALSLWHVPGAAGVLACLFYILMCDAFPGGRSPGKWLTGLKVVRLDREAMDYQASMVRNLPITVPVLLYLIPAIGPLLAYTLGAGSCSSRRTSGSTTRKGSGRGTPSRNAGGGAPPGIRCQPCI
jgi:uncharacterized RDD family membrane protein YckC